ncbi:LytTR family transcriptional regulator DNA-binding domain-containing protein [Segatella bryantii]|uniref:LytTR family DNA-binding domain-containing protein n=1 Tax=Segatella bryantii TaxID=77095 RepID=UPI001EDA0B19|nr:LytTR family DNA-binding domain-containing protein [Segatella bryantii]UKK71924.1 LytTR family transcriptional regulator DNA-binding domain-containing protein [Segatella bryantii]
MDKDHIETIRVRAISVGFAVLALGVFKPFGLGAWGWETYAHLLLIWVLGFGVCFLTEVILRFIAKMPRSYEQGVDYIIRRNLWFQLINTPLVSLMICLYRHFVLSDRVPNNQLSWSNYFETLAIIAFISFAIGLYWRFKFRSRYLATELEETRQLNEQLKAVQAQAESKVQSLEAAMNQPKEALDEQPSDSLTLSGTTSEKIALNINDLLFIETVGNYVKVCHLRNGQVRTDMLRATSKQMEDDLHSYPMIVRCHRAFLVNLAQVEQIVSKSGSMQLIIKHSHDNIPVSRSNVSQIKEVIKNI